MSDVQAGKAGDSMERVWSSAGGRMGSDDLYCPLQGANAEGISLIDV